MKALVAAMLCALGASCAHNPAPVGYRISAADYPKNPRGSWIAITHRYGSVAGELIAVDEAGIFVQEGETARHRDDLRFVRWVEAQKVNVYAHRNGAGVGAWATFGVLSTLSHGFFLIFSAPTWILVGSIAGVSAHNAGYYKYKRADQERLVLFTRFPQGLPPAWTTTRTGPPGIEPVPPGPQPKREPFVVPEPEPEPAPDPELPGADKPK